MIDKPTINEKTKRNYHKKKRVRQQGLLSGRLEMEKDLSLWNIRLIILHNSINNVAHFSCHSTDAG